MRMDVGLWRAGASFESRLDNLEPRTTHVRCVAPSNPCLPCASVSVETTHVRRSWQGHGRPRRSEESRNAGQGLECVPAGRSLCLLWAW